MSNISCFFLLLPFNTRSFFIIKFNVILVGLKKKIIKEDKISLEDVETLGIHFHYNKRAYRLVKLH